MAKYKCIIFDCDGVMIDSNNFKMNAFRSSLAEYDDLLVEQLLEYNRTHGGIPRAQKFRFFYEHILKVETSEISSLSAVKTAQFSQYCNRHFPLLPLTKGFEKYLNSLHQNKIPCFIVSGGNIAEMKFISQLLPFS